MLNLLPFVFLIPFPELYLDVLRFFNQIFSFDLYNAMPVACIWPLGFMGSLVAKTAIPLVIILALLGYSKFCVKQVKKDVERKDAKDDKKIKPAEIAGAGWFMCVTGYPPSMADPSPSLNESDRISPAQHSLPYVPYRLNHHLQRVHLRRARRRHPHAARRLLFHLLEGRALGSRLLRHRNDVCLPIWNAHPL